MKPFVSSCLRGTAITIVLLSAACAGGGAAPGPGAEARPAAAAARIAEVTVARPTRDSVRTDAEAPGTFMPFEETTISAEGAGPVRVINVEEGSRVAKGDVLIQQDPVKAELTVKQAEAALAQARANFARTKADLDRKQQLLQDKTIPQGQYDSFKAAFDGAEAGVAAAETALAMSRQQLKDLTIVAPYAGVIKERRVSLGTYARGGDALFVLMRVDPLKLQFELPEKYAARVAGGTQVVATLAAFPGQTFTGTIRTIFPAIAVQSRSIKVEATVPNGGYQIKPGFYASVTVPLQGFGRSLTIPRAAVVRREGTENVFVLRGDTVALVRVETGAETTDLIEVVAGLTEEDNVVIAGAETLEPGDHVKIRS